MVTLKLPSSQSLLVQARVEKIMMGKNSESFPVTVHKINQKSSNNV